MKGDFLALKPILASVRSGGGSGKTHLDRTIEKESEVRNQTLGRSFIQKFDQPGILTPSKSLVNDGGIKKAITNNYLTLFQRRSNPLMD